MLRSLPALLFLLSLPVHAQEAWSSYIPGEREARRLRATDAGTREAAATALGRVGDPQRARVTLLDALSIERVARVRAAIARSLALRAHPDAFEGLVQAFDVARDIDGRPLALAIAAIGTSDAARVLAEGLGREDLAAASRVALERMGITAAPHLVRVLREDPTALAAIELLGRTGDVESVPLLARLARSDLPAVRRAAIEALGRVGDGRGRVPVVAGLDDPDPSVVLASWNALRRVGRAEDAPRVEAALQEEDGSRRRSILETLLALDEERGAAVLVGWVTSDDPALVRVAGDVALEHPRPSLVSVLYGLFREGTRREEAAAALAEVEDGGGIGVLLREVEAPAAQRELAVALRRWSGRLDRGTRRAARRALADAHAGAEGAGAARLLVLRALARDDDVRAGIRAAIRAADAPTRSLGAHAAWLSEDSSHRSVLEDAIEGEENVDAWRRMALAIASFGGTIERPALLVALDDPARAPEAAIAAAHQQWEGRDRRRLGRTLRRMLRAPDARTRSCAAWSLGRWDEQSAWRALLARVERDDATEVRRAAARALATLAPRDARTVLRRRARIETDDEVRRWLERASHEGGAPATRGRQVLRFRVVTTSGTVGVVVDVVLHDGRWLRMRTLPTGELLFADLPESSADVRVRVAR